MGYELNEDHGVQHRTAKDDRYRGNQRRNEKCSDRGGTDMWNILDEGMYQVGSGGIAPIGMARRT